MSCKPLFVFLIALVIGSGWLQASPVPAKEVLCEKNASSLAREGKLDQGIDAIRQCIKKDPSRAKAHIVLGYLLLDKGDTPQAMTSFEKALELRARSSAAKTGKGIILSRAGDLKEAEMLLKDGLKLNPDPARTHYELGLLYEQLGDMQQALSHFKQGITSYEQGKR